MKFNDYIDKHINEASTKSAYFISPRGELVSTGAGSKHINMILKNPKKFGLTKEFIEDTYEKYDEPFGLEGKARNEILILLIKQGWIRIRLYPNKFWTVNIPRMNKKMKDYLQSWADKMINKFNADKFMMVRIMDTGNYGKQMTISDIAKDKLFNESITHERSVLVVKNIEDI
jgi:hypothetical protein